MELSDQRVIMQYISITGGTSSGGYVRISPRSKCLNATGKGIALHGAVARCSMYNMCTTVACGIGVGFAYQSMHAHNSKYCTTLQSQSPWRSRGYPRTLLLIPLIVLALKFESRRGEIWNLFAKIRKGSTVGESAYRG